MLPTGLMLNCDGSDKEVWFREKEEAEDGDDAGLDAADDAGLMSLSRSSPISLKEKARPVWWEGIIIGDVGLARYEVRPRL
mmetsp:Transcript_434/g.736  ORF Transcript_434/g.736 Transcript_434/m.736 type:complete len:81 (-) Transcript_434:1138-1380(-)